MSEEIRRAIEQEREEAKDEAQVEKNDRLDKFIDLSEAAAVNVAKKKCEDKGIEFTPDIETLVKQVHKMGVTGAMLAVMILK